ncbi:hypothetical protein QBC45DRAFT_309027, partial [Copromyces sp. CBS 386.78]
NNTAERGQRGILCRTYQSPRTIYPAPRLSSSPWLVDVVPSEKCRRLGNMIQIGNQN